MVNLTERYNCVRICQYKSDYISNSPNHYVVVRCDLLNFDFGRQNKAYLRGSEEILRSFLRRLF